MEQSFPRFVIPILYNVHACVEYRRDVPLVRLPRRITMEKKSRHGAEKITSRWKFFFFVERAPFASRCNFFSSVMVFWRHRRRLKIRLRAGRMTGSAGAIKRMADKRKFYCPSFRKALPIVLENIARSFFKCCPWFFKTMPVIFSNHGQRFFTARPLPLYPY